MSVSELRIHSIWWNGPSWLSEDQGNWPKRKEGFETELEKRNGAKIMHLKKPVEPDYMCGVLQNHSNLFQLEKRTVFMLRWLHGWKKGSGVPTATVLRYALKAWIKFAQGSTFSEEILCCQRKEELPRRSKLTSLRPFIDEEGILRVGGRLKKSQLAFHHKHPIILPKRHHLTKLIIEQAHQVTLHGGTSLMSAFLRNY